MKGFALTIMVIVSLLVLTLVALMLDDRLTELEAKVVSLEETTKAAVQILRQQTDSDKDEIQGVVLKTVEAGQVTWARLNDYGKKIERLEAEALKNKWFRK
jgi:hypothetical protein